MLTQWLRGRARSLRTHIESLGFAGTAVYIAQRVRIRTIPPSSDSVLLVSKHVRHPLHCRPRTSDIDVFGQIYRDLEYRCLDDLQNVRLVIDCGANVGYSSVYFLSHFPSARVIAIEPDRANFEILRRNVAPFGARCEVRNTAVWSRTTGLVMSSDPWGDGREWARTVRPAAETEASTLTAVDIGSLLATSGFQRISILKVDIEGAESAVFSDNYEGWIGRVDNLVIELHGDIHREIFLDAIKNEGFHTSTSGELFVCRREKAKSSLIDRASGAS